MKSEVYNELNKAWLFTTKLLFGAELSELRDYGGWIKECIPALSKQKSHISGKEIAMNREEYHKQARFISFDENKNPSVDALTINEIKDIDSIVEAVSEKWEYAGNRVFGKYGFIESSDNVKDSTYVLDSSNVAESSYVYGGSIVRSNSKNTFGTAAQGEGQFLIRVIDGHQIRRCVETSFVIKGSDLYFCHNVFGCHELLFSLNQRNKTHMIGNLQLPKDRYIALKKKLISEMKDELQRNKRLPSLFDIIGNEEPSDGVKISLEQEEVKSDMNPIEKAFTSTFKILFKKEPGRITEYEDWLSRNVYEIEERKSVFGFDVYLCKDPRYSMMYSTSPNRIVSQGEALELGKLQLREEDVVSFERIKSRLSDIGYISLDKLQGNSVNTIKTPATGDSMNIYKSYITFGSEGCGLDYFTPFSNRVFGCHTVIHSDFCINCSDSRGIKRSFELDSCYGSSDSYFCYNSEMLSDAMFCFNVKGKRYAIGNYELIPDKYRLMKSGLIDQLADELTKNKKLRINIFNVGCSHTNK
jgi:hypothetical protein